MRETPAHPPEAGSDSGIGRPADTAASLSTSRRRLLRGGLAATPAVLSLVSRPAPAADFATSCVSASATISANASGFVGIDSNAPGCTGIGPARWNSSTYRPGKWVGATPSTLFADYFPGFTPGATFGSVLDEANTLAGNEPSKLRRNLVAAVLNHHAGYIATSIYDISKLVSIWTQLGISNSARWVVNASGQTWDAQQTNALWFNAHLFQGAV